MYGALLIASRGDRQRVPSFQWLSGYDVVRGDEDLSDLLCSNVLPVHNLDPDGRGGMTNWNRVNFVPNRIEAVFKP